MSDACIWKCACAIILYLGVTIISIEAASILCYGNSLSEFDQFDLSDIENLLNSQYFKKNESNRVVIHGFKGNKDGRFVTNMTLAYIKARPSYTNQTATAVYYNVLVLDWSEEASANPILGDELSYATTGVCQARSTGDEFADAMYKIAKKGLNVHNTYLTGHSLGAHLAGYCGRRLINVYDLELARIYGLDPSGPLFEGLDLLNTPLGKDCAAFVGCYHTDPGNKGINTSNCHQDTWANYEISLRENKTERIQSGCPIGSYPSFSEPGTCSHDFVWKLICASLEPQNTDLFIASFGTDFYDWARKNGTATPVTNFPEKVDITLRGNFYLSVSGTYPYGLGQAGMRPLYGTNY